MSLKKEVIHPQLPLRMPCYDFVPIIRSYLPTAYTARSGITNSLDVTGGVYKDPRTYSPCAMADPRLLAIPTS